MKAYLLLALLLTGCVSPSVVHRLETENAGLRDDVADRDRVIRLQKEVIEAGERAEQVMRNQLNRWEYRRKVGM